MLVAPFKVLDAAVATQPYLLGDEFTVADLNVAAVISRAIEMDLSAVPNLKAWLTRCLERPAARAGAGAQDHGRQRDAGGRDAADRPDQSAVSTTPGPFNPGQAIQQALALHQQGRLDEAEKLYTRVLKAQRDNFDALHLLGMLNHQRGKAGEAYRLITAALKVQPRSPDALSNLALVLHALKRSDEALESLDKALALAPGHLDALNNRGIVLLDLKRPAEALAAFDAVLAKAPRHLQARDQPRQCPAPRWASSTRRWRTTTRRSRSRPAIRWRFQPRQCAARAGPRQPMRSRPTTARWRLRRTIPAPGPTAAWRWRRSTAISDAVASYDRALALQPDNADVHFNAALSLLTIGDYRARLRRIRMALEAHRHGARARTCGGRCGLARRRSRARPSCCTPSRASATPCMFVRYAPLLARARRQGGAGGAAGAESTAGAGSTASPRSSRAANRCRRSTCIARWPACRSPARPSCRASRRTFPISRPPRRRSRNGGRGWKALPSPRVALAWSGRATHVNDRNRSLSLAQLEPLLAAGDVRFVSVQRELRAGRRRALSRDPRVMHVGDELADFTDTAAVLALADLVICVDTSVAHLAGALGRPAFVLLPFQPDWRWTLDRDRSPWYPAARLFRQPAPGDWASVIARVRRATRVATLSARRHRRPTSLRAAGGTPLASRRTAAPAMRRAAATCCGLPLADHRLQPGAPARQRLMRLGVARQHREVLYLPSRLRSFCASRTQLRPSRGHSGSTISI